MTLWPRNTCSLTADARCPGRSRATRGRRILLAVLAVSLLPALVGIARGQANSDLYSYPKNLKSLDWNWYTKDYRELTFNRMPGVSPDYRMGAGDEIQIMIVGIEGPFNFKIRAAGDVSMPYIGDIKVAGLTAEEAEDAITTAFRKQQLIEQPEVLVYISSYEAKKFWVYGQVDRPGEYTMSQALTVMDGILIAGGLDFYGDRWGYLHRRVGASAQPRSVQALLKTPDVPRPGTEVIKLDLQPMRNGGVLSPNPALQNGDEIVVPTRYPAVFYVIGDVRNPGAFEVNNGERLTVGHALAQAGGPTRTAKKNGLLIRYGADGVRQDLPFDCVGVLTGKQPDLEVHTNDLLFIPSSMDKAIGYGTAENIPNIIAMLPFVR